MPDNSPEFWNLDLSKLTLSGWLLILVTIATVLGTSVALIGLMATLVGNRPDAAKNPIPRWMGGIAIGIALVAGSAFFEFGRRLLSRMGFPITK